MQTNPNFDFEAFEAQHPVIDFFSLPAAALFIIAACLVVGMMVCAIDAYRELEVSPRYQRGREAQYLWDLQTSMGLHGNVVQGRAQPYADRSTHSTSVTPDQRTELGRSAPPFHPLPADPPFSDLQEQAVVQGNHDLWIAAEVNLRG